ncbi:26S proteasome non-ATPase regulatory subunit 10 [Portunus trituberculatus]|uniref:26S proteasome non-ATPase regulatory subunit 10 n=1 Tax=Portunus trituberculatus TaxID=210409 RepID=A0A5B7CRG8_PORTR|nr:26S proteasome non-ATPase regulatory subunit 10 [Portunus trituberculatus]
MVPEDHNSFKVHEASYQGRYEEVKEKVLNNNRLLTTLDDSERQALHWAACGGHEELASFLIEHGAPVDKADDIVSILMDNWSDVNLQDKRGATALHRAASKGNIQSMALLLQSNQCSINVPDSEGNTPLHLACEEERLEAVRQLLERGAITDKVNREGKTPIQMTSCLSIRRLMRMNEM